MLPSRFCWGKREVEIAVVLSAWRDTGPCSHGSGEQYVRKHWFRVRTTDGAEMQIYFERQPRSRSAAKARWWLYTVSEGEKGI
jgi:phosphoribosylglycinamide formyltransferase-1